MVGELEGNGVGGCRMEWDSGDHPEGRKARELLGKRSVGEGTCVSR